MDNTDYMYALVEELGVLPDAHLLTELVALPVLPDEDDPAWEDDATYRHAYRLLALADVAAERQLRAALPLLLERACYGDPDEMMRGLRHSLEAIVDHDLDALTDVCLQMATADAPGARFWAIDELGILRDRRALPTLLAALGDPTDGVRANAFTALTLLCQEHPDCRAAIQNEIERYLKRYTDPYDQQLGQETIRALLEME